MSLEALLPADDENKMRVAMKTTVEEMVDKMLGERLKANKATKLTWGDKAGKRVPNDKVSGPDGFNGRLEYMRIGPGSYWIQNGKIFNGAKKRIKLEDVDAFYRPLVAECFGNFKKQALAADDSLCPICLEKGDPFVASSHKEYSDHFMSLHNTRPELGAAVPEEDPGFVCAVCKRQVSTALGLKIHKSRMHKAA